LPYYKPKYSVRLNNNNVNGSHAAALVAQVVVAAVWWGSTPWHHLFNQLLLTGAWLPFYLSILEIRVSNYVVRLFIFFCQHKMKHCKKDENQGLNVRGKKIPLLFPVFIST